MLIFCHLRYLSKIPSLPTPIKEENSDNEEVSYKHDMSSFPKLLVPLLLNRIRLA